MPTNHGCKCGLVPGAFGIVIVVDFDLMTVEGLFMDGIMHWSFLFGKTAKPAKGHFRPAGLVGIEGMGLAGQQPAQTLQ